MGLATNDVVQITFFGTLFSQRVMTVLNYTVTVPDGSTSLQADLDDIVTTMGNPATTTLPLNKLLLCMTPQVTVDYVRAQRIYPTRSVFDQATVATAGTSSGSSKYSNTAGSLTKKSALPGRKGLGRVQIPGIPDQEITAGLISSGHLTIMQTFGNTLVGEKTMAGGVLKIRCCVSRGFDGPNTFVGSTIPQDTARTMHRRTVRVGV